MLLLRFPYVMPYREAEYVVEFAIGRAALEPLGEPAYVEQDPDRTFGRAELFWAFEREDGFRFDVTWHEGVERAFVHADPPDATQAILALRGLGIEAEFAQRALPPGVALQRGEARGAVWLFTGVGASAPTAVFSRKQLADAWLTKTGYSGVLVSYPLDGSRYEAERNFGVEGLPSAGSREAQAFVGTVGERYEYVAGKLSLKAANESA